MSQPAHQERLGVQCRSQGHFELGSNEQPSERLLSLLNHYQPQPLSPPLCHAPGQINLLWNCGFSDFKYWSSLLCQTASASARPQTKALMSSSSKAYINPYFQYHLKTYVAYNQHELFNGFPPSAEPLVSVDSGTELSRVGTELAPGQGHTGARSASC